MSSRLASALLPLGIYYAKRRFMPSGVDWLWDVHRILGGPGLRTVFDVGANIGQTTRTIKDRFPRSIVHAFEPVSSTFQQLSRNCAPLDGVTTHRLALSNATGEAWMTLGADSQLNRLVDLPAVTAGAPTVERVATETLDHFCATRQIDCVDLIKIDAEGSDLRVLQGAGQLLRNQRAAFVVVEAGIDPSDPGHVHVSLLLQHMADAGLAPYAFYDYYHELDVALVFMNVLFVSPAAIAGLRARPAQVV